MPPQKNENRQFALNTGISWGANIAKIIIQMILLPIMARLIGPEEFGLYSIAFPVVLFFNTLADGGLGNSLSREPESESIVWATAFWFLLLSCCVMAICVTATGFVLSLLTKQPRLFGLMALLSTSLILLSFSIIPDARLIRRGNLAYHAIGDFIATVVGAAIAISAAHADMGAWSLAWQYIGVFLVRSFVLNIGAYQTPLFEFRISSIKTHLFAGSGIVGSRLAELLGKFAENFLYGHFFGAASLGMFNLANQISRFICDAVANPMWGALYSRSLREKSDALPELQIKLSRILGMIIFPIALFTAVSAPQVLQLVLGSKWLPAAPMLQGTIIFYAIAAVGGLSSSILISQGYNKIMFMLYLGFSALRVVIIMSSFRSNPIIAAWATGVTYVIFASSMILAVSHVLKIGRHYLSIITHISPSFISSIISAILYLLYHKDDNYDYFHNIIILLISVMFYFIFLIIFDYRRMKADLHNIMRFLNKRKYGSFDNRGL